MDFYRLGISASLIIIQGCITAPLLMITMSYTFLFNDLQVITVIIGSFSILVTNLSVQPMRITIPTFAISTLLQTIIIIYNLFLFL